MDSSQRQAITIMIQSIQAQLMGIQGILGLGAAPQAAPGNYVPPPRDSEVLTDDEEEQLGKRMESVRREAEQETADIQQKWAAQRSALDTSGVF